MTSGFYAHVVDGVHVMPVLHERLEFADQVRLALDSLRPNAIAVEIPSSLEAPLACGSGSAAGDLGLALRKFPRGHHVPTGPPRGPDGRGGALGP